MRIFSRLHTRCFCAFCKTDRRIYSKKHVNLTNVVAAILLSGAITQAYWGELDPRGLVLFCLTLVGSEIFIYLRWRNSLICNLCGFDPVIYKRSPEEASERVRAFYKQSLEDPNFLLSRSPLVERQRQGRVRERQNNEMTMLEARILAKSRATDLSKLTPPKSL